MTRLDSFHIAGLAGRSDAVQQDLDPLLNVFWGLNGAGKTTLLRILHSALSDDANLLAHSSFRRADVRYFSANDRKVYRRTLDRELQDEPFEFAETEDGEVLRFLSVHDKKKWVTHPRPRGNGRYQHSYLPISRLDTRRGASRRPSQSLANAEEAYDDEFAQSIDGLWIRLNNEALYAQQAVQQRGIAEVMSLSVTGAAAVDDAMPLPADISAEEGYEIFSKFMQAQGTARRINRRGFIERFNADPVQRHIIAAIIRLNYELYEARQPLRQLFELLETMFSGNKSLRAHSNHLVFIGENDDEIPLRAMSSGEKQLVYILLNCMNAKSNVVLIDEPELSLHVDWQQMLISAIRIVNPHVQLVIATHSPEIMAGIPDKNIFEL